MSSPICFSFDQSRILLSGNGLKDSMITRSKCFNIATFSRFFFMLPTQAYRFMGLFSNYVQDTFAATIGNRY